MQTSQPKVEQGQLTKVVDRLHWIAYPPPPSISVRSRGFLLMAKGGGGLK